MDDKLRSMRVNQQQRKNLMAAGRFGIGPLVQLGMVKPVEAPMVAPPPSALSPLTPAAMAQERRRRESMPGGAPLPGGASSHGSAGSGAGGQDIRRQAWRKLHEDDGLQDLDAFLAPKRKPPAAAVGQFTPTARGTSTGGPAVGTAVSGRRGEEKETLGGLAATKLQVKMASKPSAPPQAEAEPEPETTLRPDELRAAASGAGARAKAAAFKATTGPTVEDIRQLQLLHESTETSSSSESAALQAAIDELRDEELRRAKVKEKRRREEWRKAWRQEKRKKAAEIVAAKSEASDESDEGDKREKDHSDESDDSSSHARKRKAAQEGGSIAAKMDTEQRKFWSQKVKGCVSNDNKGFTDADLERRLRAQEQALSAGGKNLMSESEVLAMLKGGAKEKVRDKVKQKEKVKERSRSRERRR